MVLLSRSFSDGGSHITARLLAGVLIAQAPLFYAPLYAQQNNTTIVIEGKQNPNNKKVCKIIDPPTGSRLGGGRVCRPAGEWKLEEQVAQRAVEQDQERQKAMNAYLENQKGGLPVPGRP
jgi:hypothetical protein